MAAHYSLQIKTRVYQVREATGQPVKHGKHFADLFRDIAHADREMFFVVTLDQKNKVIDKHLVSMGTLTASLVHPREVFRPALLDNAAAVAFVHNHPSGDMEPSREDQAITHKLLQGAEILGMRVLDHIIVGRDGYRSFLDSGILN